LSGECDDFLDFFAGNIAVEVETVLNQAVRVGPMRRLPVLELGNHAVELAGGLEQRLLSVAVVLVGLLPVDAVVETQRDDRLAVGQELMRPSTAGLNLLFA
jgi:hypothetical protein